MAADTTKPSNERESTMSEINWRKSTFSTNGNCLEVADLPDGSVAVRNTSQPEMPPVEYAADGWEAFIAGVKAGEFDPKASA